MIVGITGSIGSGKTTAAKIFSMHHFSRIDADEIGHDLIIRNSPHYKKLVAEFGDEILGKNKAIDRKKLGNIVFGDSEKLGKLNSIMLPAIIREIKIQIKKIREECGNKAKIIVDAPLLLETKAKGLVNRIIVVSSKKEKMIQRLGRKYPKERIEKILNAQMPLYKKLKHADYSIDNDKGFKHLEKQVMGIIDEMELKI